MEEAVKAATAEKVLKPSVELIISQRDLASPTVRVAWCVSAEALKELREKNIKYPRLLLVAARIHDNSDGQTIKEVDRRLVPLHQGLEFFVFRSPGNFRIFASIVWSYKERNFDRLNNKAKSICLGNLFDQFLDRRDYGYRTALIDPYNRGEGLRRKVVTEYARTLENSELIAEENIKVEKDFFAPEPSLWLKNWVNCYFSKGPRDQCGFRRRAIFAFTLQPFIRLLHWLLLEVFYLIMFLAYLLGGVRINNLGGFIHPFNEWDGDPTEAFFSDQLTFWWNGSADGTKKYKWIIPTWLAIPAIWLSALIGVFFLILYADQIKWDIFGWIIGIVCLAAVMAVVVGVILKNHFKKMDIADEALLKAALDRYYADRVYPISCLAGKVKEAELSALPETHRTITLRFQDLKARVCKPFKQ